MADFIPTLMVLGGGAVGTWARYGVSLWFKDRGLAQTFPWGTFVINVSGSFILGAVFVAINLRMPPERRVWFLLLGTGFCGGYTTFSTFSLEAVELAIVRKQPWLALAYVAGSVVAGFIGVTLGWWLAEAVWPRGD